jgi:glycerol-1-phosphate dehydrogenase [NAD(P)+]
MRDTGQEAPFGRARFEPAKVPSDLDALCGFFADCGCGRTHGVELKHAVIRKGALGALLPIAREVGARLRAAVVLDRVTRGIAGEQVVRLLKRDGHDVREVLVPDGAGDRPHADEPSLALVERGLADTDLGVSVGAGTLNDLTKLASFKRGIPYISVATAPSMNGYTSAIAAILMRGVKRTVACHQPMAVLADLDILKDAPLELCRAGLGDLESKPTASADFRLGGLIRGTYFCEAPEAVVLQAEDRAQQMAGALNQGDPEAIAALTEALMLSGISMKLAGSSSTASGGEHLISHLWDMTAGAEGRVEGWHGAQVGVATIVTAALYDHLKALDPAALNPADIVAKRSSVEEETRRIEAHHGEFAEEVKAEWFAKRQDDEVLRATLERVEKGWHELWQDLGQVLRPAKRVRDILAAAGAPTTVQELGLTPSHLRSAFATAHHIRSRYTVLDFAHELGVFDQLAEKVLKSSGCLG